jgi:hypothetical protein
MSALGLLPGWGDEDVVVDALTCTYGYLPLHVLIHDDAEDRASVRSDSVLTERLRAAEPQATGWSTVEGANWRLATPWRIATSPSSATASIPAPLSKP